MDPVFLARLQFGLTVGFHFLFAPLSIGLAWFVLWLVTRYWRSGDAHYGAMARFWVRILAITFVVGVATGLTMEFQFGTNWSDYSRFVGDIFGAPLAIEAIFSFFLESSFLAVLVFGWNRFSPGKIWFASLMVALGTMLSAFWIIVANSWQQTPAAYVMNEATGRVELLDFWGAVFNPSTMPRFVHTVTGAIMTGTFFVIGVSAWFLLKNRETDNARKMLRFTILVAFVTSLAQLGNGHWHAVQVAQTQPEKLAAIEGIFETQTHAPALLFGIPDEDAGRMRGEVRVPALLSLLAYGDVEAEVMGLNDVPRDEWPPLYMTFFPFHLMVGLGMFFIFFSTYGVYLLWKRKLYTNRIFLIGAVLAMPLPFITNELGWIAAEVGRQPWVVYKLLRTRDAVSVNVSAGMILFSMITLCIIYIFILAIWLYLIRREMRLGIERGEFATGEGKRP